MDHSRSRRSARLRLRSRQQGGFTLIEVMVVVLIIGILLAVGIPTFLGARTKAQNLATQTNLSSAASAASVLSDFGTDYSKADATALALFEPSLTYLDQNTPSTGPDMISVDASTPGEWTGTSRSASGTCVGVELTPSSQMFFESGSCGAALAGPLVSSLPTNLALGSTVTAGSGDTAQNLADGDLSTRGGTVWDQAKWFSFDLGSISQIDQMRLYNRTDCCPDRTRDITIYFSDTPIPPGLSAAQASGAPSLFIAGIIGGPTTLPVNLSGRYVVVFGSGPATAFQEIEIMGIAS